MKIYGKTKYHQHDPRKKRPAFANILTTLNRRRLATFNKDWHDNFKTCISHVRDLINHPTIMEVFTNNSVNETKLVDALKQGGQRAIEDFYDQYAPAFYGEIKKIFFKEDISSHTLLKVFSTIFTSIATYDQSKERLFTWGFKIVHKEIRKQKTELVLKEIFFCRQSNLHTTSISG